MPVALGLLLALLPWSLKRRLLLARGWVVDPTARIGVSLVTAEHGRLGPGSRIGHLSVLHRIRRLELGEHAAIGSLNHMSGPAHVVVADRVVTTDWPASLVLGDGAIVFNRNFFDVSGEVRIGAGTVMAGGFTRIWSHGPHAMPDGQRGLHPEAVTIGDACYVGAGTTVLPGVDLPVGTTVGAASVLTRSVNGLPRDARVAGNPARPV